MSGRVSIKGRGADIFFGAGDNRLKHPPQEPSPGQDGAKEPERIPSPLEESMPASQEVGQPVSQHASLPASKQASKQASTPPETVGKLSPSTRRKLLELLEREHRTHNTYRYHDDELAAVRDIAYKLEAGQGMKVSRNDVMRASLLWALEDYTARGEESYLMQLLKEGDWRRR